MDKVPEKSAIVVGVHPVKALLTSKSRKLHHIVLNRDPANQQLHEIQKMAKQQRIKVHQLPAKKLNFFYRGNHQGVIAFCHHRDLDDWDKVKSNLGIKIKEGKSPLVVLVSYVEDPRNLGACIRSSLGMDVSAVLFPNKGSCGMTPSAAKSAAGASEKIPICQISDLEKEMSELSNMGFKLVGLDEDSELPIHENNFEGPLVAVIGGEDKGIPPHVKRNCDATFSIPMNKKAHTFNASVALSLFLYEIRRQENFKAMK